MPQTDPRDLLHRSFAQAVTVVKGVAPDQLGLPTPCQEFDVAALVRHMAGVGNRVAAMGRGEPQSGALPVPEDLGRRELGAAVEAARAEAMSSWADDEVLERKIDLPFGTFTGAMVAQIYTMELAAHAWDLASATGQLGMLDDELAETSLAVAHGVLPPDQRGGFIPFDAVVPVAEDVSAYDRLAGFLGRSTV